MQPNSEEYAPEELIEKTAKGKHEHWKTYDLGMEGARFEMLQDIFDADHFDKASADAILTVLEAFSQSNGYATADSVYYTYGTFDAEDLADADEETRINGQAEIENLDNGSRENGYFYEVIQSEDTLTKSAKSDEARAFLGISKTGNSRRILDLMNEAYSRGVAIYKAQNVKEKSEN